MGRSLFDKLRDKIYSLKKGSVIVNTAIGKKVFISKYGFISNSILGNYTSVGRNTTIVNANLGKYCSISWNVTIGATQHPINRISSHAFPYIRQFGFTRVNQRIKTSTLVGNDVWIGANAILLPGIQIGNGAVIGAGSVVTRDIPDYAVVVGVPASIIRYRYTKEEIDRLKATKWWDLNPEVIKQNIELWGCGLDEEILSRLEGLCES